MIRRLTILLLIVGCEEQVREEIIARHSMGEKKILVKYKGSGVDEVIIGRIFYHQNGDTIQLKQFSDNGEINVKWVYYDNGQIQQQLNYKDGTADGKYTTYFENGQVQREGNYKYGWEIGKWTEYYGNGKIKNERIFENGKLHCRYLRNYIISGHELENVPLSPLQKDSIDLLEQITQVPENILSYDLKTNDMIFFDNHRILHGRTMFEDYEDESRKRHLLRTWIKFDFSNPLIENNNQS